MFAVNVRSFFWRRLLQTGIKNTTEENSLSAKVRFSHFLDFNVGASHGFTFGLLTVCVFVGLNAFLSESVRSSDRREQLALDAPYWTCPAGAAAVTLPPPT